jgi:hypothetical protein
MKVKFSHLLISVITILLLYTHCDAQKRIKLTNVNSKNEFYLAEGRRVVCVLKNGTAIVGTLSKISDEQINRAVRSSDLTIHKFTTLAQ